MKKKLLYLTILVLIFLVFKNYSIVLSSSIKAINLWLYKVFPYLFIMIILNDTLINLNFESLFKNKSVYCLIASLFSGSPTSAIIIGNLYKQNKFDKNTAETTLLFTYFSNPLFLYTMLNSIFNSFKITIKLMFIHYLSNIIIYFLYRKKISSRINSSNKSTFNISSSIKKAMNTTIMVLGTITFYLVLSDILNLNLLLRGLIEMTQGLNALITKPIILKELLAMLFFFFLGLSIHTQVKCILDDYNLNYSNFFKGRALQTIIALILTTIT